MKINEMYLGRIERIDIEIKQAVNQKKWSQVAKLKAERKRIEDILKG